MWQEEFGCLVSAERTLPGNDKLKNYTNLVSAALSYYQTQKVFQQKNKQDSLQEERAGIFETSGLDMLHTRKFWGYHGDNRKYELCHDENDVYEKITKGIIHEKHQEPLLSPKRAHSVSVTSSKPSDYMEKHLHQASTPGYTLHGYVKTSQRGTQCNTSNYLKYFSSDVRLNGALNIPKQSSALSTEKYLNCQQYGISSTQTSVEFPEELLPLYDNFHNLDQHKYFRNEMWLKMDHRESIHENSYIFSDTNNDLAKFSLLNNNQNSQFGIPFNGNDSWTYSTDDISPSNSHINTCSIVNHSENLKHQKVFDKYSKTSLYQHDHCQDKHQTSNQHDQLSHEFSNCIQYNGHSTQEIYERHRGDESNKVSIESSNLDMDNIKHTGTKFCQVKDWDEVFDFKSNIIQNDSSHTEEEKPYRCNQCGKFYSKLSYLHIHHRIHMRENTYKCEECGKSFRKGSSLHVHYRIHTGDKPSKCDDCGKCFRDGSSLHIHQRIHIGEKPYKCDDCGKSFVKFSNLQHHRRIHTGEKPYKCDDCGKCFRDVSSLHVHQRIHTGEKPCKCNKCGKCFRDISSLHAHHRIHTGEKPYKCDECGKCFRHSSSLYFHHKTHTKVKPQKS